MHVPEYLFDEIEIHRDELAKRSGQTTEVLEEALRILRAHVTEHEEADYVNELKRAGSLLRGRDPKDVPYVLSPWRSKRMESGRRIEGSSRWEASPYIGRLSSFAS